jgi:AraC-like DNA-binding protein
MDSPTLLIRVGGRAVGERFERMDSEQAENFALIPREVGRPLGSLQLYNTNCMEPVRWLNEYGAHGLLFILDGCALITDRRLDGSSVPDPTLRRAGDLSFYPRGTSMTGCVEGNLRSLHVDFQPEFAELVLGSSNFRTMSSPLISRFDKLSIDLARELAGVITTTKDPLFVERAVALLLVQLSRLNGSAIRNVGSARLSASQLKQVIEYVEQNLPRPITLLSLASAMGISLAHFCKLFKNTTGCTPYRYITECRVERAQTLLESGQPLIAIAHEVGFNSQSHLTTQFKRIVGLTPGQYRSNSRRAKIIH